MTGAVMAQRTTNMNEVDLDSFILIIEICSDQQVERTKEVKTKIKVVEKLNLPHHHLPSFMAYLPGRGIVSFGRAAAWAATNPERLSKQRSNLYQRPSLLALPAEVALEDYETWR